VLTRPNPSNNAINIPKLKFFFISDLWLPLDSSWGIDADGSMYFTKI
jgi:hypothetical protein